MLAVDRLGVLGARPRRACPAQIRSTRWCPMTEPAQASESKPVRRRTSTSKKAGAPASAQAAPDGNGPRWGAALAVGRSARRTSPVRGSLQPADPTYGRGLAAPRPGRRGHLLAAGSGRGVATRASTDRGRRSGARSTRAVAPHRGRASGGSTRRDQWARTLRSRRDAARAHVLGPQGDAGPDRRVGDGTGDSSRWRHSTDPGSDLPAVRGGCGCRPQGRRRSHASPATTGNRLLPRGWLGGRRPRLPRRVLPVGGRGQRMSRGGRRLPPCARASLPGRRRRLTDRVPVGPPPRRRARVRAGPGRRHGRQRGRQPGRGGRARGALGAGRGRGGAGRTDPRLSRGRRELRCGVLPVDGRALLSHPGAHGVLPEQLPPRGCGPRVAEGLAAARDRTIRASHPPSSSPPVSIRCATTGRSTRTCSGQQGSKLGTAATTTRSTGSWGWGSTRSVWRSRPKSPKRRAG